MRIKRSVNALKKRRKIMRLAKGYFGKNHKAETKKQKEKEKFASEHSRFHDAGIYRQEYDSL